MNDFVKVFNRKNDTEILNNIHNTILNNVDLDIKLFLHGATFISGNIKKNGFIVGDFYKDLSSEIINWYSNSSNVFIKKNDIISFEITDWNYLVSGGLQTQTVEELFPMAVYLSPHTGAQYYDYGTPKMRIDSPIQSGASSTLPQQEDGKITVLLHKNENTNEISLLVLCDSSPNSGGGTIRIEVTNLPSTSYIAVSDDPGEATKLNDTTVIGQFSWNNENTDGMCIGGLDTFTTIYISASNYSTRLTHWKLCSGISDVATLETVDIPLSSPIKLVDVG